MVIVINIVAIISNLQFLHLCLLLTLDTCFVCVIVFLYHVPCSASRFKEVFLFRLLGFVEHSLNLARYTASLDRASVSSSPE